MVRGLVYIVIYCGLIISPLLIVAFSNPPSGQGIIYEIGKGFALVGFMILGFQAVLAARLKWIERPFGFDIVIRFHKHMAVFAALLILFHPLLLALGGAGLALLTTLKIPWYLWAGKVALGLLVITVVISLSQFPLRLSFERWRILHDALFPALIILAFLHSRFIGMDFQSGTLRGLLQGLWIGMLAVALILFVYHRFVRPLLLGLHPYRVSHIKQETGNVWTVTLAPPKGERRYAYLPGQFQFITFHRGRGLPEEEHHWTISSSPTEADTVSSTIKELGDFTATIGQTKLGDTATVHAPFGRFSYVLHPDERDLVFIAGGIGITPLMGMLRHMRDTKAAIPVLLLYANREEGEICFKKELATIEKGKNPRLKVVHVLSGPAKGWKGETGRIDRERIERYCGKDIAEKAFYICGPPGLLEATIETLRALGVPDGRMHIEIFSFLG
jgi:predicted ferric reductase